MDIKVSWSAQKWCSAELPACFTSLLNCKHGPAMVIAQTDVDRPTSAIRAGRMLQPNFIAADAARLSVSAACYVVSWLTLHTAGSGFIYLPSELRLPWCSDPTRPSRPALVWAEPALAVIGQTSRGVVRLRSWASYRWWEIPSSTVIR